jgi:hypothetical protein
VYYKAALRARLDIPPMFQSLLRRHNGFQLRVRQFVVASRADEQGPTRQAKAQGRSARTLGTVRTVHRPPKPKATEVTCRVGLVLH